MEQPPPLPPQPPRPPPQPVVPLGYQQPGYPPAAPPAFGVRVWFQFLGGFLIGSAVSAVVWVLGWSPFVEHGSGWPIFVVPGVKLVVAIIFLCFRGYRGWGGGVLLSIGMGVLIFFVTCAAHL